MSMTVEEKIAHVEESTKQAHKMIGWTRRNTGQVRRKYSNIKKYGLSYG